VGLTGEVDILGRKRVDAIGEMLLSDTTSDMDRTRIVALESYLVGLELSVNGVLDILGADLGNDLCGCLVCEYLAYGNLCAQVLLVDDLVYVLRVSVGDILLVGGVDHCIDGGKPLLADRHHINDRDGRRTEYINRVRVTSGLSEGSLGSVGVADIGVVDLDHVILGSGYILNVLGYTVEGSLHLVSLDLGIVSHLTSACEPALTGLFHDICIIIPSFHRGHGGSYAFRKLYIHLLHPR
jgi:hypothetical protein